MQIKFSKRTKFYHKVECFLKRKKTLKLLKHVEALEKSTIIEDKKNIKFISNDDFETQISKKSIWFGNREEENRSKGILRVGKATYLQDCHIGPLLFERRIQIGSFCSFGPGVDLRIDGVRGKRQFTSYPLEKIDPSSKVYHRYSSEGNDYYIKIGNDVFVSENVKIMQNVEIGDGVIIGARSIVTANKKLEPYSIYAGAPAKFLKYRFSPEIIEEFLKLKWWEKSKNDIIQMGLQHIDFEKEETKALAILRELNNVKVLKSV